MLACRGDLIIWEETTESAAVGGGQTTRWRAGIVTSIRRDGTPSLVQTPSYAGSWETVHWDRVHLAPTPIRVECHHGPAVDIDAFMSAVRSHTWPGHPDSPMPFASLDELRALAAPFRRNTDGD